MFAMPVCARRGSRPQCFMYIRLCTVRVSCCLHFSEEKQDAKTTPGLQQHPGLGRGGGRGGSSSQDSFAEP